MAKGVKPRQTAAVETCLPAATYGTAIIQYASVFLSRYLLPLALPAVFRWIGLALACCGVLFFLLAIASMRDSWRAGIDESRETAIVTSGIYRVSRNPAFVGFGFLYIGTALAVPNVIMLCAAIISIAVMHLQILEEERYLPRAFGDEYLRYREHTPRYILFL